MQMSIDCDQVGDQLAVAPEYTNHNQHSTNHKQSNSTIMMTTEKDHVVLSQDAIFLNAKQNGKITTRSKASNCMQSYRRFRHYITELARISYYWH